jgi:hypothetical protein
MCISNFCFEWSHVMGLFLGIFLEMLGGSAPVHSKGDSFAGSLFSLVIAAALVVCTVLTIAAMSAAA